MDILALAKQFGQSAGFQDPAEFDFDHCPHETYSSEPIPDFWERLPDEIVDPLTKRSIKISQSFLKRIQKTIKGAMCPKRFYSTDIAKTHEEEEDESGNPREMGNRFEFLVTGAPAYDGTYPGEILTPKAGKPASSNKVIESNAELAKETLEHLGFDLERGFAQIEVSFGIFVCHLDLFAPRHGVWTIDDIKYSGLLTKSTSYMDFSWYPGNIHEKDGPRIQMSTYAMAMTKDGPDRVITYPTKEGVIDITDKVPLFDSYEEARAMVTVFNSSPKKQGEYLPFEMSFSEDGMNQHKHFILEILNQFQRMLEGKEFSAVPSYDKCKKCPLSEECENYQSRPDIIPVQY